MIELQSLNPQDLEALVFAPGYTQEAVLCISQHRAYSQLKNPRLRQEDTVMILAKENGQLLGYLGILPDELHGEDGQVERVGWLSCIWVSPNARGKGVGGQLTERALSDWDGKVLASNYVPGIRKMYERTGAFTQPPYRQTGGRLYLRSDFASLLPPKGKRWAQLKPLLKLSDSLANFFLDIRRKWWAGKPSGITVEYVSRVDQEVAVLLAEQSGKQRCSRSAEDWNWMLQHPWVLSAPQPDAASQRYYFSAVDRHFSFHALKVRDDQGQLLAFMIFSRRNQWLQLPACYHRDAPDVVVRVIHDHALKWGANTFTTFQPDIAVALQKGASPAFYRKPIHWDTLVGKAVEQWPEDGILQDGDGDAGFT
jgi:GNAT superfamily N-acetyltransferase